MEKTSKELLREFVSIQHFTGTTDIMNSMRKMFSGALQTVLDAELEEKARLRKERTRIG